MGLILTDIAKEFIHTSLIGGRHRALIATAPLPKHARAIAFIFHYLGQNDMGGVVGVLPRHTVIFILPIHNDRALTPIFLITSYLGMPRVLACHHTGPRRRAHRSSGISLRKAHSFSGHAVDIGRKDIPLTIAT